jgi:hypothetical protein
VTCTKTKEPGEALRSSPMRGSLARGGCLSIACRWYIGFLILRQHERRRSAEPPGPGKISGTGEAPGVPLRAAGGRGQRRPQAPSTFLAGLRPKRLFLLAPGRRGVCDKDGSLSWARRVDHRVSPHHAPAKVGLLENCSRSALEAGPSQVAPFRPLPDVRLRGSQNVETCRSDRSVCCTGQLSQPFLQHLKIDRLPYSSARRRRSSSP